MVSAWWNGWPHWQPVPLEMLPQTGLIVSKDGVDVCAVWIHRMDCCVCLADWWISNPETRGEAREGCLEFLMEIVEQEARAMGFAGVVTLARNQHLINKLESAGYAGKDGHVTSLIRML